MRPQRYAVVRPVTALLVAALLGGCATTGSAGRGPASDRNVITQAQLDAQHFETAFDAVSALRSNWLQERGPDSFQSPTKVQVYVDNVRLGEVETLRTVPARIVSFIRHLDGVDANARYGIGHGAGAIVVSTFPSGEPSEPRPPEVQSGAVARPPERGR
jgi:hypothetical protein